MSDATRSEQACPVCGQHTLAIDEPPHIDVMGVQAYSDMLGMGDVQQMAVPAIVCLTCGTRWRDLGGLRPERGTAGRGGTGRARGSRRPRGDGGPRRPRGVGRRTVAVRTDGPPPNVRDGWPTVPHATGRAAGVRHRLQRAVWLEPARGLPAPGARGGLLRRDLAGSGSRRARDGTSWSSGSVCPGMPRTCMPATSTAFWELVLEQGLRRRRWVGAKAFYYHRRGERIWDRFGEDDHRVIHLWRDATFDQYVSRLLAVSSGEWKRPDRAADARGEEAAAHAGHGGRQADEEADEEAEPARVMFDPVDYLAYRTALRADIEAAHARFGSSGGYVEVEFRQLLDHDSVAGLLEWLFGERADVTETLRPQRPRPKIEYLANPEMGEPFVADSIRGRLRGWVGAARRVGTGRRRLSRLKSNGLGSVARWPQDHMRKRLRAAAAARRSPRMSSPAARKARTPAPKMTISTARRCGSGSRRDALGATNAPHTPMTIAGAPRPRTTWTRSSPETDTPHRKSATSTTSSRTKRNARFRLRSVRSLMGPPGCQGRGVRASRNGRLGAAGCPPPWPVQYGHIPVPKGHGRHGSGGGQVRTRGIGRGGGDRTHDLMLPKHVRYLCATPRRSRA